LLGPDVPLHFVSVFKFATFGLDVVTAIRFTSSAQQQKKGQLRIGVGIVWY